MKLLFIGDIMGRTGRDAVFDFLPQLKDELQIDFTIANGENASGGLGMNRAGYEELRRAGVDYFTMGNHTFSKKEICALLEEGESIVRPANLPSGTPGDGLAITSMPCGKKIAVINLLGRVYLDESLESPFTVAQKMVEEARRVTPIILLDIHAEATSEKEALGYLLDGTCSAVVGTHTHVQTADARILPRGTAYITDVGRTGAVDSVLGLDVATSLARFTGSEKRLPFRVATGRYQLCAVCITINDETGLAEGVERICRLQR